MTPQINAADYAAFLAEAYLSSFIRDGGAAVKFAVGADAAVLDGFGQDLKDGGESLGFTCVRVAAAQTRISMIQQVFFAVAAQIDWSAAAHRVSAALASELYLTPAGHITIATLAAANEVDQNIVRRELQKRLTRSVVRDYTLAKDFRVAMAQLCLAQLEGDAGGQQSCASILEWLRGELRLISCLLYTSDAADE